MLMERLSQVGPAAEVATNAEPIVGLGMPVYNGDLYVAAAIQSILDQSLESFELVICDNASTDGTENICRDFAAADERIKYHRNPTNLGAHPNYNLTFHLSRGRFFKWVPHDDVLHPEYLESCVQVLAETPNTVLCQTGYDYIDEVGHRLGVDNAKLEGSDSFDVAARFAAVTNLVHTCYHVMGLFPRDILADSILLPSFHGADRALLAQLAVRGPFAHIPRPLLSVRDHSGRYTRAKNRPADRARWHDSSFAGRFSLPTWRLYGAYWGFVTDAATPRSDRIRLGLVLLKWWFVNWNAARMAVDVIATIVPDVVGAAQRIKQRLFSPAPGIDQVRDGRPR